MIFGSTDYIISPVPKHNPLFYGASEVTEGFYKALFKYGTYSEYHFFVRNTNNLNKGLSDSIINPDKVKIINNSSLPSCVGKIKYSIFFISDIDLSSLAYLRSYYAKQGFPICGLAHTVSYSFLLKEAFFNNMVSKIYPFDSIICSSPALKKAISNINRLVSKSVKDELRAVIGYKGRLDQLPLGIDADSYGKTDKMQARAVLGLPKDKIIILYFGRLSLYDKMDLFCLLDVFKELLRKKKNIVLLIAGNNGRDNYAMNLKKMATDLGIASDIRFNLNPSAEKKYLLYSASDIFVSPSDNIQESFGLTILEAMASSLPVVVSDWNGYKELVEPGKSGFLIPTYWADCLEDISRLSRIRQDWEIDHLLLAQSVYVDTRKLYKCLEALIGNKALREGFGRYARNTALNKYNWSVLIPKYERLWRELARLSDNHKIKRERRGLFSPEYFQCFRHYPSNILNRNNNVVITEKGTLFFKDLKEWSIPAAFQGVVSARVIFIILSFLSKEKIGNIDRIQRHVNSLFIKNKLARYKITYHILWLLKKDLIRLANYSLGA